MFGNLKTIRIALALMLTMIVGTIQAQTVKGNVKDSFGDPVIGATVMEKGSILQGDRRGSCFFYKFFFFYFIYILAKVISY